MLVLQPAARAHALGPTLLLLCLLAVYLVIFRLLPLAANVEKKITQNYALDKCCIHDNSSLATPDPKVFRVALDGQHLFVPGVFNRVCIRWENFEILLKGLLDINISLTLDKTQFWMPMDKGHGCTVVPVGWKYQGHNISLKMEYPIKHSWSIKVQSYMQCSIEIKESIIPESKLIWKSGAVVCIHGNTRVQRSKELRIYPRVTVKVLNDAVLQIEGKLRSSGYLSNIILFTSTIDNPSSLRIIMKDSFSVFNGIWILYPDGSNGFAGIEGYRGGLFWANGGIIINSYGANRQLLGLLYFSSTRVRILDLSIFADSKGVNDATRTNLVHLHQSLFSLSNGHIVSVCEAGGCPVSNAVHIEGDFSAHLLHIISNTVLKTTESGAAFSVANCQGVSFEGLILDSQSVGIVIDNATIFPIRGLIFPGSGTEVKFKTEVYLSNAKSYHYCRNGTVLSKNEGQMCAQLTTCTDSSNSGLRKITTAEHSPSNTCQDPRKMWFGFSHFYPIRRPCPSGIEFKKGGGQNSIGTAVVSGEKVVVKNPKEGMIKRGGLLQEDKLAYVSLARASFLYPHIAQGYGACLTDKQVGLFVQAQKGIDAQKVGKAALSSLTMSEKIAITTEIARAFFYIHNGSPFPCLVHGDSYNMKKRIPHNILLDSHSAHGYLIDLDWTVEQVVKPAALENNRYLIQHFGNISEAQRIEVADFGDFMNYVFQNGRKDLINLEDNAKIPSTVVDLIKQCLDKHSFPNMTMAMILSRLQLDELEQAKRPH